MAVSLARSLACVSASECRRGPDQTKFTYHRVTSARKSQCSARRECARLLARSLARSDRVKSRSKIEIALERASERARERARARLLVESKRNKRATRARMQNNAPRRARRGNPSRANRWIDPLWALAFAGARTDAIGGIPSRG